MNLNIAKTFIQSHQTKWQSVLWSGETKVELSGHNSSKRSKSPKHHQTHSEAWAMELVSAGAWTTIKMEGVMSSSKYQSMLAQNLQVSLR